LGEKETAERSQSLSQRAFWGLLHRSCTSPL